ncbi:hypothetical protein GGD66_002587 [Bradyrhizobium sp. CIR48]|uniref:hypothetical protein n=1 Tax=Bradyrhizobium sp. CIR48 TaxID=2663840 RepID=UPI0016064861|nr:hypothetical protein [Bradyrhizobium sp. CIR48]MBB4424043.1 hypothetical protein [Bradyrhizobium sp. CIR48]
MPQQNPTLLRELSLGDWMCREDERFVAIEPELTFQEDIAWVVGQRMSDAEIYRRGAFISSSKLKTLRYQPLAAWK